MFIRTYDDNAAINTEMIRSLQIVPDQKQYNAEYALLAYVPFTFDKKNCTVCIDASDDLSALRRRLDYIVDLMNLHPKYVYIDKTSNEWKSRI